MPSRITAQEKQGFLEARFWIDLKAPIEIISGRSIRVQKKLHEDVWAQGFRPEK
jgi:hypothetical protein